MQTLELPQTVRIGPYDYEVNPPGYRLDEGACGHCAPRRLEIVVDESLPAMQLADTYLHEVLHGIWDASGLGDEASEEGAVRAIATGLLSFMRDNPDGLDVVWECIGTVRRAALMDRATRGNF